MYHCPPRLANAENRRVSERVSGRLTGVCLPPNRRWRGLHQTLMLQQPISAASARCCRDDASRGILPALDQLFSTHQTGLPTHSNIISFYSAGDNVPTFWELLRRDKEAAETVRTPREIGGYEIKKNSTWITPQESQFRLCDLSFSPRGI
jgi:hypothetical protein